MEDDNKEHEHGTPPQDGPPAQDTPPVPHAEPEKQAGDDTKSIVDSLVARVGALENTVTGLLPENRDETPVKRPWTHKRF